MNSRLGVRSLASVRVWPQCLSALFVSFSIILAVIVSSVSQAEISGRIHLEENDFYGPQVEPIKHLQDNLTFELESKNKMSDSFRVLFEPRVQFSGERNLVDVPIDFNLRDTLIEFKSDAFHVQLGSFIKQWEGPDGFNPMDIATVKNYRDPFGTESLGSVGLNFFGGEKWITWDAFYVPFQTPARLPGSNSRWLPRTTPFPLQSASDTLLLPFQPILQVLGHQQLNSALENNFGGRIQFHGDSWDFSLAAYQGAAQVPIFKVHIIGNLIATLPDGSNLIQLVNPIQLEPTEYLRQTYAVGFVSTISDTWVFRVAGRFDQPLGNDPLIPAASNQLIGGFEKTFTALDQTVMVSLQYAYGLDPDSPNGVLTIRDPFKNAILYGMRFPIRDDLTLYYGGLWSHLIGATYNRIRIDKKMGEMWSIEFGGDLLRGSSDNLLGIWTNESRLSLGLLFQF